MKQTPEQAADEAMQYYAERKFVSEAGVTVIGFGEKHEAARQSIIKAFQDRERLLVVLDNVMLALAENAPINKITVAALSSALAAIEKVKAES